MYKKRTKILISGPSITQREINYVAQSVKDGWNENSKKYIKEFEEKFARYIGTKYALATDSCTGAMHLALLALGIKDGDEVIIPDITWISTASVVHFVGAKPVFADIEPDTWCVSPKDIEKKITKKAKAIIPVHLYGHPAEMRKIMEIAKKYNLYVIEDAAEAIGAEYFGRKVGSIGDVGCFSFNGAKLMVTGEGGMMVTNNKRIYERAKFLNNQAQKNKMFWNLEIGSRYRMSNMQAALGTVQLSRIDELIAKKRKIFEWYKEKLGNISGITLNTERKECKSVYWMVTIVLDRKFKIKKEKLIKKLSNYNISCNPFFYPLSSLPPFKTEVDNPVSFAISPYAINLPCGLNMKEEDVDYVYRAIKDNLYI